MTTKAQIAQDLENIIYNLSVEASESSMTEYDQGYADALRYAIVEITTVTNKIDLD